MRGAALWLVALAAVAGLVWLGWKNGVFKPAQGAGDKQPTPARPFGPGLSAGEYTAGDSTGANAAGVIYGAAYQGACLAATKGQGGALCTAAGQIGQAAGPVIVDTGKKVASTAVKYHPVALAAKGAKGVVSGISSGVRKLF